MQNILWIGEPYFAPELKACGFSDLRLLARGQGIYAWNDLVRLAGFTPDLLIVADDGGAPFVLGMEDFPCLTIFYSVFSHIHPWHHLYARGFDVCMLTQGGAVARTFSVSSEDQTLLWPMPPFAGAQTSADAVEKRDWNCLYLADSEASLAFGQELGQHVPGLAIRTGTPELSRKARIVVRHMGDHPGLDFGMFEIMGHGACLVVPRMGHGLRNLFVDGEHLVQYKLDDPGDAAYHINFLLEHPELVDYIAQTGKAAIDAGHRADHRASSFSDHIFELASYDLAGLIAKRQANAATIRKSLAAPYVLCSHGAEGLARTAYLAAATGKFGLAGLKA